MPHMLPVATTQIRYPVAFIILVIPDDTLLHDHHPADSTRTDRPQKGYLLLPILK